MHKTSIAVHKSEFHLQCTLFFLYMSNPLCEAYWLELDTFFSASDVKIWFLRNKLFVNEFSVFV